MRFNIVYYVLMFQLYHNLIETHNFTQRYKRELRVALNQNTIVQVKFVNRKSMHEKGKEWKRCVKGEHRRSF